MKGYCVGSQMPKIDCKETKNRNQNLKKKDIFSLILLCITNRFIKYGNDASTEKYFETKNYL